LSEDSINLKEIKVIGNENQLPLSEDVKIAAFSVMTNDNLDSAVLFFRYLAQAFTGDIDFGFIDENITEHDIEAMKSGIVAADVVLFVIFFNENSSKSLNKSIIPVIENFTGNKKSIFITNSDIGISTSNTENLILMLEDSDEESLVSTIVKLSGKKLPE
jgi:hypothetical protein